MAEVAEDRSVSLNQRHRGDLVETFKILSDRDKIDFLKRPSPAMPGMNQISWSI